MTKLFNTLPVTNYIKTFVLFLKVLSNYLMRFEKNKIWEQKMFLCRWNKEVNLFSFSSENMFFFKLKEHEKTF